MKEFICKMFGHIWGEEYSDDLPSSNGGYSLSVRCWHYCERCGAREEFRSKWD